MKFNKITLTVTVEVTDILSAPSLLDSVMTQLSDENIEGELQAVDGDKVTWKVKTTKVEI